MAALSYPFDLATLSDRLNIASVNWGLQRNDELSGTGDGRVWSAELARPLWTATVTLATARSVQARGIAARLRALQGSRGTFLFADPFTRYPAADPRGEALAGAVVRLDLIGSGRVVVDLAGLPAGFALTAGDRFTIVSGGVSGGVIYHGEISGDVVAGGTGVAEDVPVFPRLPLAIASGATVVLVKPYLQAIISPGSLRGATDVPGALASGASFQIIQKM
jgi:hypothetical protein